MGRTRRRRRGLDNEHAVNQLRRELAKRRSSVFAIDDDRFRRHIWDIFADRSSSVTHRNDVFEPEERHYRRSQPQRFLQLPTRPQRAVEIASCGAPLFPLLVFRLRNPNSCIEQGARH